MVSFATIVLIAFLLSTPVITSPTITTNAHLTSPTAGGDAPSIPRVEAPPSPTLYESTRKTRNQIITENLIEYVRQLIVEAMGHGKCFWFAPIPFLNHKGPMYDMRPKFPPQFGLLAFLKDRTTFYPGLAFCHTAAAQVERGRTAQMLEQSTQKCLTMSCPNKVVKQIASAMSDVYSFSRFEGPTAHRDIFDQLFHNWQFDTGSKDLTFLCEKGPIQLIPYKKVFRRLLAKLGLPQDIEVKFEALDHESNWFRLTAVDSSLSRDFSVQKVYKNNKKLQHTLISVINIAIVSEELQKKLPPKPSKPLPTEP